MKNISRLSRRTGISKSEFMIALDKCPVRCKARTIKAARQCKAPDASLQMAALRRMYDLFPG
ncbi:hypothetical protein HY491_02280 [Candidatus Woesearchaeota archaeon]|nr:hypothetical protein [Candidatus Woesearchaeota archaeon]